VRVLLDTNVVVSALLFGGAPRALLRALCAPPFELWTSRPRLRELAAALGHNKLRAAVTRTGLTVENLVQAYTSQTFVAPDASLPAVTFAADPGDEPVVATALAVRADWLVTGDQHLLEAKGTLQCRVLTVAEALRRAGELLSPREPRG